MQSCVYNSPHITWAKQQKPSCMLYCEWERMRDGIVCHSVEFIPRSRPNHLLLKPHLNSLLLDFYLDLPHNAHTHGYQFPKHAIKSLRKWKEILDLQNQTGSFLTHPSTRFPDNLCSCFCLILLTNHKQVEKITCLEESNRMVLSRAHNTRAQKTQRNSKEFNQTALNGKHSDISPRNMPESRYLHYFHRNSQNCNQIRSKSELVLPWPKSHPATNFQEIWFSSFCIILQTGRQTAFTAKPPWCEQNQLKNY